MSFAPSPSRLSRFPAVHRWWSIPRSGVLGLLVLAAWGLVGLLASPAAAQFAKDNAIEFTPAKLDTLDSSQQKHLDRAEVLLADGAWQEGIETLRRVADENGEKLILMPGRAGEEPGGARYLTLRSFVQWRISALPAEALAIYRRQVDPQAELAYRAATAAHNRAGLAACVSDAFCSSWGDDALLALGDAALQQGDFDAARGAWQQILPLPPQFLVSRSEILARQFYEVPEAAFAAARNATDLPAALGTLLDQWYELQNYGEPGTTEFALRRLKGEPPLDVQAALARFWKHRGVITCLSYPDTSLAAAEIHARFVLASILQRDVPRAREELESLTAHYPEATGILAGREGNLAASLGQLLAESQGWKPPHTAVTWQTFAGNPSRQTIVPGEIDIRAPLWKRDLPAVNTSLPQKGDPLRLRRPGEADARSLSYFPVVWRDALLYCDQTKIYAVRLADGEPYWPGGAERAEGEIYSDITSSPLPVRQGYLGTPRFTLTVHGDLLFARMGSPLTDRLREGQERADFSEDQGYLVCLDLSHGGRLLWKIDPDGRDWAFEGTPITDGRRLWVGMRRGNLQPEANIACFDVETHRMLWRTPICSANTAGRFLDFVKGEITHNLLTLAEGTLYYNSNLGCVVAVEAHSGRIRWASTYEREPHAGELEPPTNLVHIYRDLNPAVVAQGSVYVCPADNPRLFAFDAATGLLQWRSVRNSPEDASGILGVVENCVIAYGDRLWWFKAAGGRFLSRWPESETVNPVGLGRPVLVGDAVYWPTRTSLDVLGQTTPGRIRQPIDLGERNVVAGGNLLVAGEYVVLVSPDLASGVFQDRLYVFRRAMATETARQTTAESGTGNPGTPQD